MKKCILTSVSTLVLTLPVSAFAQSCTQPPSCESLGYTRSESECPQGSVKCPWNTSLVYCPCDTSKYKYSCRGTNESPSSAKCGNLYASCTCATGTHWDSGGSCVSDRAQCSIGDIYYTDNTCVSSGNHDSSKEVLGIVVYVNGDGVGGQIMAPWPIDEDGKKSSSNVNMQWSTEYVDISNLPNYTSSDLASKDYDSCGNTDRIVSYDNASTYPAAWAARKYAPTDETSGQWCLPAAGIMTNIYNNQTVIQTSITAVGGVSYPNCCTWSSSEYGSLYTWEFYLYGSYGLYYDNKDYAGYVRPVMEF